MTVLSRRLPVTVLVVVAAALALPALAFGGGWKFQPTINAPWALEDDGDLDVATEAAGLCRSSQFVGANPYGATTNVDVINGDVTNNTGFSNLHCTTPQNETTVVVNPTNARNVVAGSNDYRVCCDFTALNDGTGWAYASFDGGTTWTNVQVPGLTAETGGQGQFAHVDSAGDPALAFAPDGTLYYSNIVFSRVSPSSGVAVSTSQDGGRTWSRPNMVTWSGAGNFFNDKAWIAAGPNGTVVVTWTEFNQGPHGAGYRESPIVMAISRDGGNSWNRQGSPVSDGLHPFDQGSQPAFDSRGTLYVAYEGASPLTGYRTDEMLVARSTNLGQTFTTTSLGRVYDDLDCYPVYAGRQTLTGEHFRLNSYPSLSIDPTNGHLAVVWADDQGAGSCGGGGTSFSGTTNAKLELVTSANGTTWSSVATLGSGDVVFPSVAQYGGKSVVSYYTRAFAATGNATLCNVQTAGSAPVVEGVASSNICLDYAARVSTDAYATEHRLTTESANPSIEFSQGTFIGDYSQVAMGSDGVAHAVWTDFRGRPGSGGTGANQDVYTNTITP
jgi:BNR repeat-like domain